jgi:hypothetical protein
MYLCCCGEKQAALLSIASESFWEVCLTSYNADMWGDSCSLSHSSLSTFECCERMRTYSEYIYCGSTLWSNYCARGAQKCDSNTTSRYTIKRCLAHHLRTDTAEVKLRILGVVSLNRPRVDTSAKLCSMDRHSRIVRDLFAGQLLGKSSAPLCKSMNTSTMFSVNWIPVGYNACITYASTYAFCGCVKHNHWPAQRNRYTGCLLLALHENFPQLASVQASC